MGLIADLDLDLDRDLALDLDRERAEESAILAMASSNLTKRRGMSSLMAMNRTNLLSIQHDLSPLGYEC